jgi:hypothetical protein
MSPYDEEVQQSMALRIQNWWILCRTKQIDAAVALRGISDFRSEYDEDFLGG